MQYQIFAHIDIGDDELGSYSSVSIRQQFNAHHEFLIRVGHNVYERTSPFSLENAPKKIGKPVVIQFLQSDDGKLAYEFKGLVCEISIEQSDNFTSDIVFKGYSPTILLENGPHLLSFYEKKLPDIIKQLTQGLTQGNHLVSINPAYKDPIKYICQYRESTFHFLNRLSSEFGEWCYYDGSQLFFGKPSSSPNIEVTYGVDVANLQITTRILPLAFSSYSYLSKKDEVISYDAPPTVNGLDPYADYALQESNKIFTEPVNFPIRQRVESKTALEGFVKKQKSAMAANLEVLSGSSDNPYIQIGAIADVKILRPEGSTFKKQDYEKFLITSIEHHASEDGNYYNTFEGIPAGIEAVPVKNVILPIAEPQIAIIKDNKDPDNMGRVRVQMLWQKGNEMTDWLRVMTPDAGGGKDGAKNRGLVVVPEPGDQVLICFRYNDPDRPFVMGSMFHGKTGGGGGQGNNTKSLNSKSGHTVSLDDGKGITIVDKTGGNKIEIDGTNSITITASQKIELTNGKSTITMDGDTITISADNVITMSAKHVGIDGSEDAAIQSGENGFSATSGGDVSVNGKATTVAGSSGVTATGAKATLNGDTEATVNGGGKTTISAGGKVAVQGAIVALN